jgi:hypothetical protein
MYSRRVAGDRRAATRTRYTMNQVQISHAESRDTQPLKSSVVGDRSLTRSTRALAVGAVAAGAFALGAAAIGALAIGSLAVGAFALKRGRVRSLTIEHLEVRRLHVHELTIDGAVPRALADSSVR